MLCELCFFIESALAEHFRGTKLLPKKGRKFDAVVEKLRVAGVEEMAADYTDLRKIVITWYHDHVLKDTSTSDASILTTPLPSNVFAEADRASLLVNTADDPLHHDPFLSISYPPSLFSLSSND